MEDALQRQGRIRTHMGWHGIAVMLSEAWAYEPAEMQDSMGASEKQSKKRLTRQDRTNKSVRDYVRGEYCRREYIGSYMKDTGPLSVYFLFTDYHRLIILSSLQWHILLRLGSSRC